MTLSRLFFLFLIFTAGASSLIAGETNDPRMNEYDVLHYDLAVTFDISHKTMSGSVVVEAKAVHPLYECVLCATQDMVTVDSVFTVFVEKHRLSFTQDSGKVIVTLSKQNRPLQPEVHFRIKIFYHAISTYSGEYDGGGIYFTKSGRFASSGEPQFARRWWPCKDVPSDKATISTHFTVPDSFTAVSNGILKSVERHNGMATFNWSTEYPTSTYLVTAVAAKFVELNDTYHAMNGDTMQLSYYVFPEDVEKAKVDYKNAPKFLEFMSNKFCEYPFLKEKFGYAEAEGDLTMENQTLCTIQNTMLTGDGKSEITIFHETAHHWFGDMITTADWHNTWLNEGFATYAEALYLEFKEGTQGYQRHINSMMSLPVGSYAKAVVGRSDTAFWDSFGSSVYFKGALTLHMLRKMLGDSVFFTAMRRYVNNPKLRYANATTDDFIHECETASGQNLGWFFQQWVYASSDSIDRPILRYSWNAKPDGSHFNVGLTIKQENAPTMVYRLPLPIVVHSDTSSQSFPIVDSLAEQTFNIIVAMKPDSIQIDPDKTIFGIVKHDQ